MKFSNRLLLLVSLTTLIILLAHHHLELVRGLWDLESLVSVVREEGFQKKVEVVLVRVSESGWVSEVRLLLLKQLVEYVVLLVILQLIEGQF